MTRIYNWLKSIFHINRYKYELEEKLRTVETHNTELQQELQFIIQDTNMKLQSDALVQSICTNANALIALNSKLSGATAIWGDESRLHVSEKAAVYNALFNLNSGSISIDDYTFTGSNVSFLTGSHDMNLFGLLRRDCEIKNGNDIVVGKGVWFASNSTILGPCEIGDNAVIAAGAVVIPGTIIKENEVYGGVPAKKIMTIEKKEMTIENESVIGAMAREEGVLFVEGWSDKRYVVIEESQYEGHYLLDELATIYTTKEELGLFYVANDDNPKRNISVNDSIIDISKQYGLIKVASNGIIKINRLDTEKTILFFGKKIE